MKDFLTICIMITQDTLFKIIGGAIILLLLVGIFSRASAYQKTVEGMTSSPETDKTKLGSTVSSNSDKISDALLISKYRSNYEDAIIGLEKAVSLALVSEVVNNSETISADPISDDSMKAIANINALKSFRESLNTSMVILDKN